MTFAKCPSCGVLFHIAKDEATFRKPCCDRCKAQGYMSRLKWETPRRNRKTAWR